MGVIYCITSPSGKKYIGQTTRTAKKRWSDHVGLANRRDTERSAPLVCMAIRKYGADNFTIETLIECENEELDFYEEKFIKEHDTITPNGYNILGGPINSESSKKLRNKLCEHYKTFRKERAKPKRKYDEDDYLPMYVIHYKCRQDEGYRVYNHPTLLTKVFSSRKLTMEQKKQLALDYLKTATTQGDEGSTTKRQSVS